MTGFSEYMMYLWATAILVFWTTTILGMIRGYTFGATWANPIGVWLRSKKVRKVRLFELELLLDEYVDLNGKMYPVTLGDTVLLPNMQFYVESSTTPKESKVDLVGYHKGVEILRENTNLHLFSVNGAEQHDILKRLNDKHKLSLLAPYINASFTEGKDHYAVSELIEALESAAHVEFDGLKYITNGTKIGVMVDGDELKEIYIREYDTFYAVKRDSVIRTDSKVFTLEHLMVLCDR